MRRIRPLTIDSNITPFCEMDAEKRNVPPYYRERRASRNRQLGLRPEQCSNRSTHLLDGKNLCHVHAGKRALEILLEMEDA